MTQLLPHLPAHLLGHSARDSTALAALWITGFILVAAGGKAASETKKAKSRPLTGALALIGGLAVLVATNLWHHGLDSRL